MPFSLRYATRMPHFLSLRATPFLRHFEDATLALLLTLISLTRDFARQRFDVTPHAAMAKAFRRCRFRYAAAIEGGFSLPCYASAARCLIASRRFQRFLPPDTPLLRAMFTHDYYESYAPISQMAARRAMPLMRDAAMLLLRDTS